MQGTVKWFGNKGFGFIIAEDGDDVFVHYSQIEQEGFRELTEGQRVTFDKVEREKGFNAEHVRIGVEE